MSRTWNLDGVFAVHKPGGISSADVLRDLQRHFNPSEFFKPVLEAERQRRREEPRNQLRRRRDKRIQVKLGHGGTLDPIATGVLITGVGKGTKQLNNFLACTKSYEAVVLFGAATDTYDRVGKVVSRAPYEHVTREKVEEALKGFRGKIMQRPSIFSALKVQGKKLYEYAREGKEPPVEIAERPVEVSNLEIVEWYEPGTHSWTWPTEEAGGAEKDIATKLITKEKNIIETEQNHVSEENDLKRKAPPESAHGQDEPPAPKRQKEAEDPSPDTTTTTTTPTTTTTTASSSPPAVKLTMTVSSGFYVRSLSHDLGLALGSNALMSELVRTRQGDFVLAPPDRVLEYADLDAGEAVWAPKVQRFLDEWCEKMEAQGRDGGGGGGGGKSG
ncbi:pseudouridine synthase pus4 [Ophidiomyces ophidiicola]|nr:pseudouridine synthase pus4 [Ophidiomyces ophidiicola]